MADGAKLGSPIRATLEAVAAACSWASSGGDTLLQGVWWDRSLDHWMFLGTDFMISVLAFPHI